MDDELKELKTSFNTRKKFYASLGQKQEMDIDDFVRAMTALCFGFGLGTKIDITDETPSDMDGIVLKVKIT